MPEPDLPRLIESASPLNLASLDWVHEKNVRHGHISALPIWPARRPLAACQVALIATLLPDPGTPQSRKELLEKIGGKVVTGFQKKKVGGKTVGTIKERTDMVVLRRGNENSPDIDWFRAGELVAVRGEELGSVRFSSKKRTDTNCLPPPAGSRPVW